MRRTLRQATADVLSEDLPDEILEKLAENLQGLGIRKVADLIAIRLALWGDCWKEGGSRRHRSS